MASVLVHVRPQLGGAARARRSRWPVRLTASSTAPASSSSRSSRLRRTSLDDGGGFGRVRRAGHVGHHAAGLARLPARSSAVPAAADPGRQGPWECGASAIRAGGAGLRARCRGRRRGRGRRLPAARRRPRGRPRSCTVQTSAGTADSAWLTSLARCGAGSLASSVAPRSLGEGAQQGGLAAGSGAQIEPAFPRGVLPPLGFRRLPSRGWPRRKRRGPPAGSRRPGRGWCRRGRRRAGRGHRRWRGRILRRVRRGRPRPPGPRPGCPARAGPPGSPLARRCRLPGGRRFRRPGRPWATSDWRRARTIHSGWA